MPCGRPLAVSFLVMPGLLDLAGPALALAGDRSIAAAEIPGVTTVDPVLFYCNGPDCVRSVHPSRKALACGCRRMYRFRGGFVEWKKKNYPFVKE